jgi:hypothetical protein
VAGNAQASSDGGSERARLRWLWIARAMVLVYRPAMQAARSPHFAKKGAGRLGATATARINALELGAIATARINALELAAAATAGITALDGNFDRFILDRHPLIQFEKFSGGLRLLRLGAATSLATDGCAKNSCDFFETKSASPDTWRQLRVSALRPRDKWRHLKRRTESRSGGSIARPPTHVPVPVTR